MEKEEKGVCLFSTPVSIPLYQATLPTHNREAQTQTVLFQSPPSPIPRPSLPSQARLYNTRLAPQPMQPESHMVKSI